MNDRRPVIRSRAALFAVLALATLATGCSRAIVGEWHLVRASPSRDLFAIDDAVFAGDRSFEATVTVDGKTRRETGSYRFDGFNLTMLPSGGGARTLAVTLRPGLIELGDGKRQAFLKKGRRENETPK